MAGGSTSLAGKLLVAPAAMADPNFADAVTLVLVHNVEGAFGLVLDRQLAAEVTLPPGWSTVSPKVHVGGPCEPERLIVLGRPKHTRVASHYRELCDAFGGLGVLDADLADPDDFADIRFFAGYAGWGPGQLDWEVSVDAWVVADAVHGDAFDREAAGLRSRVLRRVLAARGEGFEFPDDPSAN